MEKKAVRIFSVLLAVAVLMATSVPSYAASEGAETFYQIVSPLYFAWTKFQEWKEAHPNEPETKYPGYHPGGTLGGGSSREELNQKYNEYATNLPVSTFDSAGRLIWCPSTDDVLRVRHYGIGASPAYYEASALPAFIAPLNNGMGYFLNAFFGNPSSGPSVAERGIAFGCEFKVPVTGNYQLLASTQAVGEIYFLKSNGDSYETVSVSCYDDYEPSKSAPFIEAGTSAWSPAQRYFESAILSKKVSRFSYNWYLPVFEVTIPESASDKYGEYYNISTRPTSITGGNYGIVGDNGQITRVEDNSTIVNETNNTYYNPATGQTASVTDWTYDYSTRTYTLTLEGDKTSTVTYGDENITITETTVNNSGDTITNNYTIYYVIGDTGTENPPAPHVHDFQPSGTVPASCTQPGQTSYDCSCGETKTEAIPALGHDWQIKQTVTTEYDDTGQLVQEGYTIYECTRCKEQYKAASGAGPPSVPDFGGSSGVFSGIFGLLLDFLSFFWNTFKDFTGAGVKAFLAALSDGASDIFGLLNPFDWSA